MPHRLAECFKVTEILNRCRRTLRMVWYRGKRGKENNGEHQWQLAMFCWWTIDHFKLDLDQMLVMRLALAHDCDEGFAPGGDVSAFYPPGHHLHDPLKRTKEKEKRDRVGLEKFSAAVKDLFPDILETVEIYRRQDTPEAKFVSAMDKFLSSLNVADDYGKANKILGVTLTEHHAYKGPKCAVDPTVAELYRLLHEHCTEHESELFPAPRE